jgi:tetratricopeptide (TPR) repeat protein
VSRANERGDFERPRAAERRQRWIGRESEQVHYQLGLDLARRGETEAARRALERSLVLYPRAETWTTLGNLERVAGHHPAALDALDSALALAPGFALAHRRRGETLAQMGELQGAVEALREARRLAPRDREIVASLRAVLAMQQRRADAREPGHPSPASAADHEG